MVLSSGFDAENVPLVPIHLKQAPVTYRWFWCISSIATFVVATLAIKQLVSYSLVGAKIKRETKTVFHPQLAGLYTQLFLFFPLSGIVSWAALFAPKFCMMFVLLLRLYEVWCLLGFWELMVDVLNGPDDAFQTLQTQTEAKIRHVPPFCCFPCFHRKRKFCKNDLILSWWLTAQYGVFAVVAILSIVISEQVHTVLTLIGTFSIFVCMYGLFILYHASKVVSQEFHLTKKFALIKVSVLVMKAMEILVNIPGVIAAENETYDEALMGMAWLNFVVSISAVPFTVVALFVFPSSEIDVRHLKHFNLANQQVELQIRNSSFTNEGTHLKIQTDFCEAVTPDISPTVLGIASQSESVRDTINMKQRRQHSHAQGDTGGSASVPTHGHTHTKTTETKTHLKASNTYTRSKHPDTHIDTETEIQHTDLYTQPSTPVTSPLGTKAPSDMCVVYTNKNECNNTKIWSPMSA